MSVHYVCVSVLVCACVMYSEQRSRGVADQLVDGGAQNGVNVFSKFHFVDLAGSERVSRTGNRGERFKGQYLTHTITHLVFIMI